MRRYFSFFFCGRPAERALSPQSAPAFFAPKARGRQVSRFRMVQSGGLAAGGERIFSSLLLPGKLGKLLIHWIVKGNFPFPLPAQCQNYIYGCGCAANDNLAKGVECVLDMRFVGFIFGHGNPPFLIIKWGGSTPCCRPLIAYLQRRTGLSTAARSGVHFIVDWLGWLCYSRSRIYLVIRCLHIPVLPHLGQVNLRFVKV